VSGGSEVKRGGGVTDEVKSGGGVTDEVKSGVGELWGKFKGKSGEGGEGKVECGLSSLGRLLGGEYDDIRDAIARS
jgi:hypothetical protein